MRTKTLLALLTLALAVSALHIKAVIICNKHAAFLTNKMKITIKAMEQQMMTLYGCKPKVIRFFKIKTTPYMVNLNGTWYGWQIDQNHVSALGLTLQPGAPVEVAVIDTGLAPGANVNADWLNAKAITSFVDDLIASGVCSDYGIANLYNATNIEIDIPIYFGLFVITVPYQFPYNETIYKYCVMPNVDIDSDGDPDTVIVVQLTEPYDIVGHGTFVSSVINGFLTAYNGTEYVTGVVTNETYPYLKVVPIKADVIYLVAFGKTCTTLAQCLNSTVVPSLSIYGGIFDDYSLTNATAYVASLAQTAPVKVVNMSLGGWYDASDYSDFAEFCQETISVLTSAGVIPVVAAGNEHMPLDSSQGYEWPAMCKGAYPVSALTVDNKLASFSNYGPVIAFSAPGDSVAGVYPAFSLIYKEESALGAAQSVVSDASGDYVLAYDSGTSYASPIAAAVVALAISQGKGVYSVMNGARDIPPILGYDVYFGWGEVYLPGALSAPNVPPSIESVETELQASTIVLRTLTSTFMYYPSSNSIMTLTSPTVSSGTYTMKSNIPFVGLLVVPLLKLIRNKSKRFRKVMVVVSMIALVGYATGIVFASTLVKVNVIEPKLSPITVQGTIDEVRVTLPAGMLNEVSITRYYNGLAVAFEMVDRNGTPVEEDVMFIDENGNIRNLLKVPLNRTSIIGTRLGVYKDYLVYVSVGETYVPVDGGAYYTAIDSTRMVLLDKYGNMILNATAKRCANAVYGAGAYEYVSFCFDANTYLNGTLGFASLGHSGSYYFLAYVDDFPNQSDVALRTLNITVSGAAYIIEDGSFTDGNNVIMVNEIHDFDMPNITLNIVVFNLVSGATKTMYLRSLPVDGVENVVYCPSNDRLVLTLLNTNNAEYMALVIRNVTQGTPSAIMMKGVFVLATYKCDKALVRATVQATQNTDGYALSFVHGILDLDTGVLTELHFMPWMEKAVFLDENTLLGFNYYYEETDGRLHLDIFKINLADTPINALTASQTQTESTSATNSFSGSIPSISLAVFAFGRFLRRLGRRGQRK